MTSKLDYLYRKKDSCCSAMALGEISKEIELEQQKIDKARPAQVNAAFGIPVVGNSEKL